MMLIAYIIVSAIATLVYFIIIDRDLDHGDIFLLTVVSILLGWAAFPVAMFIFLPSWLIAKAIKREK